MNINIYTIDHYIESPIINHCYFLSINICASMCHNSPPRALVQFHCAKYTTLMYPN